MDVQPYLFFDGRCEEAIEFYKKALGAEVKVLLRFKDNPEPQPGMTPAGAENKVMHANFRIGDTDVLASDGRCLGQPKFQGFRCRCGRRPRPKPTGNSPRSPRVARCRCRSAARSSRRASAWSPTSSASAGWFSSRSNRRRRMSVSARSLPRFPARNVLHSSNDMKA